MSASIGMLLKKFASPQLLRQSARKDHIRVTLNHWKKTLLELHALLDDSEEKQRTTHLVKIWLGEHKRLSCEFEGLLGDLEAEGLRRNFLLASQVRKMIATLVNKVSERLTTISLKNEAKVYVRENDKEVIVELFLRDEGNDNGVYIISYNW